MDEQTQPSSERDSTRDSRDDPALFGPASVDTGGMLPGLESMGSRGPTQTGEPSDLEAAVVATLQALAAENVLSPRDAARVRLAISLARIISDKERTGKTSTVGNDARVMLELLDGLAPAAHSEADAELRAAMLTWGEHVQATEQAERDRARVPDASPA